MPTSAGHKPSSNNAKGSNDRPSNIGACNTASSPPNLNPTDEANAPLIYAAISAKCSDDGHTIVRPTAFFKSLSGQVERAKKGKAFLIFGDGDLTACKPISDDDLAEYLADAVDHPAMRNRILPIGGLGGAITPRQQGALLFDLLGREPKFRSVPEAMLDVIIAVLASVGHVFPAASRKAELARIGRYYATESMLNWDPVAGKYDADATPETGTETLADHYRKMLSGERAAGLGDHAVF